MAKVVLAVSADWRQPLGESVIYRDGVERVTAPDAMAAIGMARALKPRLVVLDADDPRVVESLRLLREDMPTRAMSVAVLAKSPSPERRGELTAAGANAVLTDAEGPGLWDDRFEELLGVPPRREVRVAVAITIWSRREKSPGVDVVGVTVNLSVSGLLLETRLPLPVGTTLNLSFRLPTAPDELRLMGRIVWTTPGPAGTSRSGVEFLGFHGRAMEEIVSFSVAHSDTA
jgi:CheY-like chemotaxis protein